MAIGKWKVLGNRDARPEQMPALSALAETPMVSASDVAAMIGQADAARDSRDWITAADRYRAALEVRSGDGALWVQFGHALKESGDPVAAEQAYRQALSTDPTVADTHLQLGHVLKIQGRREAAMAAYAEAARRDPLDHSAERELVHLGGRDLLPEPASRSTAMWQRLSALGSALADAATARREWIGGAAYPLAAYDRFRRDIPVRPPPGPLPASASGALVIVVAAGIAAPFLVRATLRSLQDQSVREWRAFVMAPEATRLHPVASFGDVDARISFITPGSATACLESAGQVLTIAAGTILDPEALAWLMFAADRTGSGAVFADHDHGVADPMLGLVRAEPWLPGIFDPDHRGESVAIVLADPSIVMQVLTDARDDDGSLPRHVLHASPRTAHVARLLGTRLHLPLAARDGKSEPNDGTPGYLSPAPEQRAAACPTFPRHDHIAVLIPTRDSPALLTRALASLRATARHADRLDIVVLDNGVGAETAKVADLYGARVVAVPGAFNWSRASNIGAQNSDAALLVFANDDIEMLTDAWDDILADVLSDGPGPDRRGLDREAVEGGVGAVGIRLLYPDRTVQHAGMVFGLAQGNPEHEGRGRRADDGGPDARLVSRRSVAAVTGAFLALRRDRFAAVGGFDAERLFVGHSDVDLCLKLREIGLRILYVPEIEAVHAESQTRGLDETKAQVAWDEAERLELLDRWGTALTEDPGVSPYWAVGGVPFDGLREPSLREVIRHLDISARPRPWRPTRRIEQEAAIWRPDALI